MNCHNQTFRELNTGRWLVVALVGTGCHKKDPCPSGAVIWDAHQQPPSQGYALWINPVLAEDWNQPLHWEVVGDTMHWDVLTGQLQRPSGMPLDAWCAIVSPDPLTPSRIRTAAIPSCGTDTCHLDVECPMDIFLRLSRNLNGNRPTHYQLTSNPQRSETSTAFHAINEGHGAHRWQGHVYVESFPTRLRLIRQSHGLPPVVAAEHTLTFEESQQGHVVLHWHDDNRVLQ